MAEKKEDKVGEPSPSRCPDAYFQSQLAAGTIMLQRPKRGGKAFFYPRAIVPGTGEEEIEWFKASGKGVVHSTTVVRRRKEQGGDYNVALVDFEEGGRTMTQVIGVPPEQVRIGMAVQAVVKNEQSGPLIFFEPIGASS